MAAAMLSSAVRHSTLLSFFQLRRLPDRCSSSSATAAVDVDVDVDATPHPEPHFMVEYLVNSCGLSAADAAKVSKPLAHLQSTEKPDAVLNFMRSQGFDCAHLRKMICLSPRFLCCDVENIAPKFRFLRDMGLSESDLIDVILSIPSILKYSLHGTLLSRLEMWERLLGSRELLLKHMKKKRWFFNFSIEKRVQPNLKFLRDECGIPEERVSLVMRNDPRFIIQKLDTLRDLVVRAKELGMPLQSKMFLWTLDVLNRVSKERVEAKVKLMRSFGWSESEFSTAVRKAPTFLSMSQEELRRKMEFLVKEAGYTHCCIAHRPTLLLYSLDKRLIPRFHVMEMLKSKRLLTAQYKLHSLAALSDKKFMEKFVLGYKEKVPELLDICEL